MAKKQKNMASLFVYQALSSLLTWANKGEERGFFIVLCDRDKTHVAFQNLDKVSCDGSTTIGCDPELLAAFETIEVGVNLTSEELLKDSKFMQNVNKLRIDEKTWRWVGFDYGEGQPFQYNKQTAQAKKGGES